MQAVPIEEMPLGQARAKFGGAGVSDEDMLMRAIMQGDQEIETMRGAGQPLKTLMAELEKYKSVRYIQVRLGGNALTLRSGAPR